MEEQPKGYIYFNRGVQESWIYPNHRKFTRFEAWVDMLFLANWKEGKSFRDGSVVVVKRGDILTSLSRLSGRWLWSIQEIRTFLSLLVKDSMIKVETGGKKYTQITICNYNTYQGDQQSNNKDLTKTQQRPNNYRIKEIKEINIDTLFEEEVLNFLNLTCKTNYSLKTKKTISLISARAKEGFGVDDFKKVITTKFKEWGSDQKMKQYLRPETLFGTKFESYLNQSSVGARELTKEEIDRKKELDFINNL